MIDISYDTTPEYYLDYKKSLELLKSINDDDYDYPEEKVQFHIYTEVKNEMELMAIKSYLATQNLDKTELTVWSDWDITDNPLIQPYKDLVSFCVYDAKEVSIGTPLEGFPLVEAKDNFHYLTSDLARVMFLWKTGGVWYDMDVVLLRDFKPLFDQEYMYMWGSGIDYATHGACATVLGLNKQSEFATELLREISITRPIPNTASWSKDGVYKNLYKRYKYPVLPAAFFNTEWQILSVDDWGGDRPDNAVRYPREEKPSEDCWFQKPLENKDHLFLDAFSWHWHNGGGRLSVDKIAEGSKFDILSKYIDNKLKEKGII